MPLNKIDKKMLDFNPATSEELSTHTGNNAIHTTQAEKDKLSGIEAQANNYVHPTNHSPSIITQDANNRFVTDAEKTTWNGKADASSVTTVDNKVNEMRLSGATGLRPAPTYIGQMYFDTTLGKPVYAKVLSPAQWVDSTGAVV